MVREQTSVAEQAITDDKSAAAVLPGRLMMVSSHLYELGTQAHLIHLNIEAPEFFSLHKFLKKQYKQHRHQFDRAAELVRSMEYFMPMCSVGLKQSLPNFKHVKDYAPQAMLGTYLQNLEELCYLAQRVHGTAAAESNIVATMLLEEICSKSHTAAWKVKATLRRQS